MICWPWWHYALVAVMAFLCSFFGAALPGMLRLRKQRKIMRMLLEDHPPRP